MAGEDRGTRGAPVAGGAPAMKGSHDHGERQMYPHIICDGISADSIYRQITDVKNTRKHNMDSETTKNMLPTVDLTPLFSGDNAGINRETQTMREACRNYGFFRVVNHDVPLELMARAIEISRKFFTIPVEEKMKLYPIEGSKAPQPAGYMPQPAHLDDKNEYLLLIDPQLGFNLYPEEPAEFREIMEECYEKLTKLSLLLQEMLNECMGLPPGFLRGLNASRTFDLMAAHRYCPAAAEDMESNGVSEHQDGNVITLIIQDDVGGLEVLKDGEWIPATPSPGSIIANLGDTVQVLSNNKFKSAVHRVRMKGAYRHSIAFFLTRNIDMWLEPLPQFTAEIGEAPHYKGFIYRDYLKMRFRNKEYPPVRPEDFVHITHYAI